MSFLNTVNYCFHQDKSTLVTTQFLWLSKLWCPPKMSGYFIFDSCRSHNSTHKLFIPTLIVLTLLGIWHNFFPRWNSKKNKHDTYKLIRSYLFNVHFTTIYISNYKNRFTVQDKCKSQIPVYQATMLLITIIMFKNGWYSGPCLTATLLIQPLLLGCLVKTAIHFLVKQP